MNDIIIDQKWEGDDFVTVVVGFQGYNQIPLLMVWKEYRQHETAEVNFAEVLFKYENEIPAKPLVPEPSLREQIFALLGEGKHITALRKYREVTGDGLADAKEYVGKCLAVMNIIPPWEQHL